jgi:hypothetical protein
MRTSVIASFVLLAAFGFYLRGQATPKPMRSQVRADNRGQRTRNAPPQIQAPAPAKPVAPPTVWEKEVSGEWFQNREEARQDALITARHAVIAYLQDREPPIRWEPSLDFVARHIRKGETDESHTPELPGAPMTYRFTIKLAINADTMKDIHVQDRSFLSQERMWLVGKGLAGLVLLFGAVAGYVRLDDYTKGYLSRTIKWSLILIAIAGAAAIWLIG